MKTFLMILVGTLCYAVMLASMGAPRWAAVGLGLVLSWQTIIRSEMSK